MLSAARAERLARRAARRGGDGSRGLRARRAWRRLVSAADGGDEHAVEAAWQGWLREPGDELWQALCRWRGLDALGEAVFAAAVGPDREPSERRSIGEFCARLELAPDDAVRRALFYVLTGQAAQHRAVDPDGVLITAAYQGVDETTRDSVRQVLMQAGDLDLMRVMAGPGQERERLWHVMRDLPLAEAVDAAARSGDGERPADLRDRLLFDLLRQVTPEQLTAGRDELAKLGIVRLRTVGGSVESGALSGDGRRLAIVSWISSGRLLSLFNVPSGTMVAQHRSAAVHAVPLCYAGDALIVGNFDRQPCPADRVLRCAGDRLDPIAGHDAVPHGPVIGLAPLFNPPGGYAVLSGPGVTSRDADGGHAGTLDLPDELRLPSRAKTWMSLLATEPGGRLAIAGQGGFAVYDATDPRRAALLGQVRSAGSVTSVRFCGPERLVTIARTTGEGRQVALWRLGARGPELQAARGTRPACDPVVVPGRAVIAVRTRMTDSIRFLDATTLSKLKPPPEFATISVDRLWNSADGSRWALARSRSAMVFPGVHPALAIADRPFADWRPGDLAAMTAVLADPALPPAGRRFAELLRSCLECRFGTEVGIGPAGQVTGGDDIGLSEGGDLPVVKDKEGAQPVRRVSLRSQRRCPRTGRVGGRRAGRWPGRGS